MIKFTELKEIIASIERDAHQFYSKGNKAAGTRVRTGFQKVKSLASEIRAEISKMKKNEA